MNTHACDRCGADLRTTGHTISRFNTDTICPDCEYAERRHPEYQRAVQAEQEQIRRGNYNFAGIGLPEDLKNKKKQLGKRQKVEENTNEQIRLTDRR